MFFLILILIISIINWLFLFLDNVFYSKFKKIKIINPVFIIGVMRSGTTYLYNVLHADNENFTSMKLWELVFAPSIIQKKMILFIYKIDKKQGGVFIKKIKKLDKKVFLKSANLHPLSLFSNEEDEVLFFNLFSSTLLLFLFPKSKYLKSLVVLDKKSISFWQKFLLVYYKNCIKRHLYVFGEDKIYLAKSPTYSGRMQVLLNYFRQSKIIYIYRDPNRTIPSAVSFISKIGQGLSMNWKPEQNEPDIINKLEMWYQNAIQVISNDNVSRIQLVDYEIFKNDLINQINNIYIILNINFQLIIPIIY